LYNIGNIPVLMTDVTAATVLFCWSYMSSVYSDHYIGTYNTGQNAVDDSHLECFCWALASFF